MPKTVTHVYVTFLSDYDDMMFFHCLKRDSSILIYHLDPSIRDKLYCMTFNENVMQLPL